MGDDNEISVLVTSQGRLQISADLDVKSLGKLKQMLEQYEQILKLLSIFTSCVLGEREPSVGHFDEK